MNEKRSSVYRVCVMKGCSPYLQKALDRLIQSSVNFEDYGKVDPNFISSSTWS